MTTHELHDDDAPIGRVLSRREAMRLLALSGAAVLAGCERGASSARAAGGTASAAAGAGRVVSAAGGEVARRVPACLVKPELTIGPYFVDKQLERSDIRVEPSTGAASEGLPLALAFNVSQVTGGRCAPLAGAMVDVWQCDAKGVYSGVNDRMVGFDTQGQKFLRGYQVTDAAGVARFTTIYPGWYQGRTVHIHFKVRNPVAAALAGDEAKTWDFTSQLFFDEALTDRVFARAPYAGKGRRDTTNATDGIYRRGGGEQLLLSVDESNGQLYAATFDIGLDLSDAETGRADRGMGGPGGPGGRGRPPRRPPGDG